MWPLSPFPGESPAPRPETPSNLLFEQSELSRVVLPARWHANRPAIDAAGKRLHQAALSYQPSALIGKTGETDEHSEVVRT